MSLQLISAEIGTVLSGVTGVGTKIYNYEVYVATWSAYLAKFKDTTNNIIKGWEYYRKTTPEDDETTRTNKRYYNYFFRGIYSLGDDGSTLIPFQILLENICTAFRNKPDLNGTALTVDPIQIEIVENRQFGDVLCHYTEMSMVVMEEVQWTE